MTPQQALSFAAAAGVLTLLPGPDTFLVLRNAARDGWRSGLATTTGICAGLFVHATVSALGMAAALAHLPGGLDTLRLAGALYLAFLGVRSLRAAIRGVPPPGDDSRAPARSRGGRLFEGFLTNVLNPKAMLFYLALLPQFVAPGDPVWATSLALAGIHWCQGMAWLAVVSFAADRVRGWLVRPAPARVLEGASAALFLGFGLRLALERL